MKKRIWITGGAVVAIAAVAGGATWYRSGEWPAWMHSATVKGAEVPSDPPPPTLETDAPDDGWLAHRGLTSASGQHRSLPTVHLASSDVAREIGLTTTPAETVTVAPQVVGNAEITYALHDYAHVTSRVAGWVADVPCDEGEVVRKGRVLVVIDSADVGSAKSTYLSLVPKVRLAQENFDRIDKLIKSGAASEREYLTARADLNQSSAEMLKTRQTLLNLGFTAAEIEHIEQSHDTTNLLNIVAPMDGTLVERHAIKGEVVMPPSGGLAVGPTTSLFDITDLHHLWCWIDVREVDVPKVKVGQDVRFTISGTETPIFPGKVELIGFDVNTATRTVRIRAEVNNIDGRLRSNQFGRATIRVGDERSAIVVPRAAVQSDAGEEFVFLPLGHNRYRTQRVETRTVDQPEQVEIAWGIPPGQEVVTTGSFELKSELLKSTLGGE